MTDREAALSGALLRACWLVRLGWDDQRIKDRLVEDYYQLSERQRQLMVDLARQGVAASQRIKWRDPQQKIDWSQCPQLPQE